MENSTFTFSKELFTFHLSSSAKLKTCFSCKENVKKCTNFKEQNSTRSGDNTEI